MMNLDPILNVNRTEPFGIDVSSNNDFMDIDKLKNYIPKVSFAWARSGMSWGWKDPKFDYFRDLYENQLGVWFGAYHVMYPGESPVNQAKKFVSIVGKDCRGYAWDVELTHGKTPAQIRECMRVCSLELLNMGLPVWGYTSPGWANGWIMPKQLVYPAWINQIKWWFAQYTLSGVEYAGVCDIMNGVKRENVYIHQTTSSLNGRLFGQPVGSPKTDGNRWLIGKPPMPPTSEDEIIDMTNVMNIDPLSQVDPRWKDIRLGNSAATIGSDGCLMTGVTMFARYLGVDTDPAKMNAWLTANGGYYDKLFVWKSIEKLLPGLTFTAKYTGSNLDKIDESLSRKMPCLVHVDYNPATSLVEQHWVLIIGKSGASYIINDPRDGSRVRFEDVYGDPATNIYNVATYSFTGTISDAEKLSRLWLAHPTLH